MRDTSNEDASSVAVAIPANGPGAPLSLIELAVQAALAEYFDPDEVRWKPQSVKGNRALAIAYIDARLVQDRLDSVVGVSGWRTAYRPADGGSVECQLSLRLSGEWITRADVGSPSEQPDDGDRLKAAYSDSLKRAAVAFGIGRYLYRLPHQWVDYDPMTKKFVRTPSLPEWAKPGGRPMNGKEVVRLVTKDEVAEIERCIAECEAAGKPVDREGLLKWLRVPSLADLTIDRAFVAVWQLNQKRRGK